MYHHSAVTPFQIAVTLIFAVIGIAWAATTGQRMLWIERVGFTLWAALCIYMLHGMIYSDQVLFSNDGPLGALVAQRTTGYHWTTADMKPPSWGWLYWTPIAAVWAYFIRKSFTTKKSITEIL